MLFRSQTLNFAEKVFNPEGAIQAAAALQRLGVAQSDLLDPLRLMDLSRNDPTELQNQIAEMSKQFVQLNEKGQFEIMPGARRQIRELEQHPHVEEHKLAELKKLKLKYKDEIENLKLKHKDEQ